MLAVHANGAIASEMEMRRAISSGSVSSVLLPSSTLPARVVVPDPVSYTHLRAHETVLDLVCRLLLEKKKEEKKKKHNTHICYCSQHRIFMDLH